MNKERLKKEEVLSHLGAYLDSSCAIALREQMSERDINLESSEFRCQSPKTLEKNWAAIRRMTEDWEERVDDLQFKWKPRFEAELVVKQLELSGWATKSNGLWKLKRKLETSSDRRDLYKALYKDVMEDVKKQLVMLGAKIQGQQEQVVKLWYRESGSQESSKILQTLELGLRAFEVKKLKNHRESWEERVENMIKEKSFYVRGEVTPTEFFVNLGESNPWKITQDLCKEAYQLGMKWLQFWSDKWCLLLGGISTGKTVFI
jgi:hypothetical protein